jgi:hypothetical protein
MVSKCANPACTEPFLYFHRGKLFRLETEGREDRRRVMGDDTSLKKSTRRIEFYWLCADCAETMTLAFDRTAGISVRPQAAVAAQATAA